MGTRLLPIVVAGLLALFVAVPAATAQFSNVETVEGPSSGERTTLTISPHVLTDEVSARALGVSGPNDTRWALTLIGVTLEDSLGLSLSGEELPIERVTRPEEGEVGPTRLYVSQETFLTIAGTGRVEIRIGDTTTRFPEQMREEMQHIHDKVM